MLESREQIQKKGDPNAKGPEISGQMELEVNPSAIAAGEAFAIKVYLIHSDDKPWRLRGITVTTRKDAKPGPSIPAALSVTAVPRGERTLVAEFGGVFEQVTNSWVLDAQIVTERGDAVSNKVVLRK
jgi:hypothetical protein